MHRLFAFLVSVTIALSLGLGSAAHATEWVSGMEVPQSLAWMHSAHDGDEVPRDADKNYPHHHMSCHGDHIGVPVAAVPVMQVAALRIAPLALDQSRLARAPTHPALRPPQV